MFPGTLYTGVQFPLGSFVFPSWEEKEQGKERLGWEGVFSVWRGLAWEQAFIPEASNPIYCLISEVDILDAICHKHLYALFFLACLFFFTLNPLIIYFTSQPFSPPSLTPIPHSTPNLLLSSFCSERNMPYSYPNTHTLTTKICS